MKKPGFWATESFWATENIPAAAHSMDLPTLPEAQKTKTFTPEAIEITHK